MNKKTIKMAAIAAAVICAAMGAITLTKNVNVIGVFGNEVKNDYGCVANCTAEYYPSSAHQIVRFNQQFNGVENVRFIAKASKPGCWFQDVDDTNVYTIGTDKWHDARVHGRVVKVSGIQSGFTTYKQGDLVAFYGKLKWVRKGSYEADTLEVVNPTFYHLNDKIDFNLINKTPVYLYE